MSLTPCNNSLNIDSLPPKWERVMQSLDLVSCPSSMPLLEYVYISLEEVIKVRKTCFQESHVWALLCQGIDAIQFLFLTDDIQKDGIPTNLVTLSTYLCTPIGKVILGNCTLDEVKDTIYCCDEVNDLKDDEKVADQIEKTYVYSLGQTIHLAINRLHQGIESSFSSTLINILDAMIEKNASQRISMSGLLNVCQNYQFNCDGEMMAPFVVKNLYWEAMDSLPADDVENVDEQVTKDSLLKMKESTVDECGNCITSCESLGNLATKRLLTAHEVLSDRKIFEVIDAYKNSSKVSGNLNNDLTISTIHKGIFERRKMLELLRLSVNLEDDKKREESSRSTTSPDSFNDLVLLLKRNANISNTLNDELSKRTEMKSFVQNFVYKVKNRENVGPEFVINAMKTPQTICILDEDHNEVETFMIRVVLLNGLNYNVKCKSEATLNDVLQTLVHQIGFATEDTYLLGFAYRKRNEFLFIGNEKLVMDLQSNHSEIYLRFKFFLKDVRFANNEIGLHLFYLQLRQHLIEGFLLLDNQENASQLTAYALQAEFGDHNNIDFPETYFHLEHYLEKSFIDNIDRREFTSQLVAKHRSLNGLSRSEAEQQFMDHCSRLVFYGKHLYTVLLQKDDHSSRVILGISIDGIDIFEDMPREANEISVAKRLQSFEWNEIQKICYTDAYFCVIPRLQTITGWNVKYKFFNDCERKSVRLFEMATEYHRLHTSFERQLTAIKFNCDRNGSPKDETGFRLETPKVLITGVKSLNAKATEVRELVKSQLNSFISKRNEKSVTKSNEDRLETKRVNEASEVSSTESPIRLDIPPTPPKRKKKQRYVAATGELVANESPSSLHRETCKQMVQQIEQHNKRNAKFSESCEFASHLKRCTPIADEDRSTEEQRVRSDDCGELIVRIEVTKSFGTLGFKVANGNASVDGSGVFVQSISPGSGAETEKKLRPGDEILEVNGTSLRGIDYSLAVQSLKDSPVNCQLTVKRIVPRSESEHCDQNDHLCNMPSLDHHHQVSSGSSDGESQLTSNVLLFNGSRPLCDIDSNELITNDLMPDLQLKTCEDIYLFLNTKNTRKVRLTKNVRGIGMSFCGGIDVVSNNPIEKLIRVKRIFASEPADKSGQINVGDVIVEANGRSLVRCTKMEAVNILHSLADNIELLILKPDLIPSLKSPKIVTPSPSSSFSSCPSPIFNRDYNSPQEEEYEVTLVKINGSLGFTIVKVENDGFFVKELTKEPAVSCQICSGDQILLVNGIDVSSMSHTGAISFLRSLPDTVTLKLLHSNAKHTQECNNAYKSFDLDNNCESRSKKQLRHEARMMINDKTRTSQSPNRLKVRRDRRKSRECLMDQSKAAAERGRSSDVKTTHSRPKSFTTRSQDEFVPHVDASVADNTHLFIRQSSVIESNKNRHSAVRDACFMRWRGTTLADDQDIVKDVEDDSLERSNARDEQDSGFGESTGPTKLDVNASTNIEQSPSTTGYSFYVTLDRRWHGRMGFSLMDDTISDGEVKASVVRAVFPNSVAAKDGRIRVGDKLLEVNGESMINRPAKEVIDNLRKIRGKLTMLFVRNVQQSDL